MVGHRRAAVVALVTGMVGAGLAAPPVAASDQPGDQPWQLRTIASGWRGADGVDLGDVNGDGRSDVTSGWEQGGVVTVSVRPEVVTEPWPTVTIASRLHMVEDAVFADMDGNGGLDVVTACECRRVTIHFGPDDRSRILDPTAWSSVVVAASADLQRWIKVAVADIDGDGRTDIVGGGKASPATVGWFRAPDDPRDGSAWAYAAVSEVAWTMSLIAHDADGDLDPDVVLSDRLPVRRPDGTVRYDLRGSRWLENPGAGAGWTNHPIGFAGGEHKFLEIADVDGDGAAEILEGASGEGYNTSFVRRHAGDWLRWTATPIPQPERVGRYQDVATGDLDLDGDLDLAFSYSHAEGGLSGVAWLSARGDGTWQRGEISGPPGTKYDNLVLEDIDGDGDLDVLTSEQVEQLGVIWFENPVRSPPAN
jgi:hypothetical protein